MYCCVGVAISALPSAGSTAFFVGLYRFVLSVLDAVTIVRPETIMRWHRAGFRAFWHWKSRAKRAGRPQAPAGEGQAGPVQASMRIWAGLRIPQPRSAGAKHSFSGIEADQCRLAPDEMLPFWLCPWSAGPGALEIITITANRPIASRTSRRICETARMQRLKRIHSRLGRGSCE